VDTACGSAEGGDSVGRRGRRVAADEYSPDCRPDGNRNSLRGAVDPAPVVKASSTAVDKPLLAGGAFAGAEGTVSTTPVDLLTYQALPAGGEVHPAVVVVHENRGVGALHPRPGADDAERGVDVRGADRAVPGPGRAKRHAGPVPTVITNDPPPPFSSRQQEPAATPAPLAPRRAMAPRLLKLLTALVLVVAAFGGGGPSWHARWAC